MEEEAPVRSKTEVIITFLEENSNPAKKQRVPGGLKGKVSTPADFNAPLDDLKDYM